MRRLTAAIALALTAQSAAAQLAPVHLDLTVSLDPATRELRGHGVITVDMSGPIALTLGERFEMLRLRVDGVPLTASPVIDDDLHVWRLPAAKGKRRIEAEWRGTVVPLDATMSHRDTLTRVQAIADPHGSFLPSEAGWYPAIGNVAASHRVALELPIGQRGLVPGTLLEESETDGRYRARFDFPYPAAGIDLMAGPYRVDSRDMRSVSGKRLMLRTYFHPEIADLAAGYLEAVRGYINRYERLIGEYPYTEFSVVSSPTPTGLGMPTLTYIGVDVLRLPFIRTTSLGHEVLHNWWGNGVRPDYASGNWSEGLTTFMADYANKERESEEAARTMRLEWLRDFAALPPGADRSLAEFTARVHGMSQIVGYNKAAMMFLMLRDRIGHEAFDAGLRQFWRERRYRIASWDDLRRAFEAAADAKLAPFFDQWLSRTGAPEVRLASAEAVGQATAQRVRLVLTQSSPTWRVSIPVTVRTERDQSKRAVELASDRASFTINTEAPPTSVVLDPDFRVFRRLAAEEAPPILRQAMVDPSTTLIVASPALTEGATTLAQRIADEPPRSHPADAPPPEASLLVIGLHHDVDSWLAHFAASQRPAVIATRGTAQAWTASLGEGRVISVISVRDAEALRALARPLPHYGRQSWLVFDGAKVLDQGVWPAHPQELPVR